MVPAVVGAIQSTRIEQVTGQIHLTTLLAHASGKWISSDLPVCACKEVEAPHRIGAALTYARRYALFALVGIAGEDDLDAPDVMTGSPAARDPETLLGPKGKPSGRVMNRPPMLAPERSAELLDRLLGELALQEGGVSCLPGPRSASRSRTPSWRQTLACLRPPTRRGSSKPPFPISIWQISILCQRLDDFYLRNILRRSPATLTHLPVPGEQTGLAFPKEPPRRRSKDHLAFIRSQGCLVCQKTPADAHHLKFAQPRTLDRKVSDEFTVPLCRSHHQSLHRHGGERAWWTNLQISPLPIAKQLWDGSPVHLANGAPVAAPPPRPRSEAQGQ